MSTTIKIGVTDLSFHHLTASLVSNVLIHMGFEVERYYAPHEANFQQLED